MHSFDSIAESVGYIYHSALPFVPRTPFWEVYHARENVDGPLVLQGRELRWKSLIRTVRVPSWAFAAAYSHNGSLLAVCGDDFSQLIRSGTGERVAELERGHGCGDVESVSFSCDDQTLATASDNSIRLWDVTTGSLIATLKTEGATIRSLAFHADVEDLLVVGNEEGQIHLWDVKDRSRQMSLSVPGSSGRLCWLRRSGPRCVLIGCKGGIMEMWCIESSQRVRVFSPPSSDEDLGSVKAVASSVDGSLVASGSSMGSLVVYNADTGDILHCHHFEYEITSVAFSPTESMLAVTLGSDSQNLHLFYFGREHDCFVSKDGHRNWVRSVAFTSDGRFLASASFDATVNICEASTIDHATEAKHHSLQITRAHFSHDGSLVVSTSLDETVKVWDAATGALCATLEGHNCRVWDAVLLSDNVHIVSTDFDQKLILWDWRQGRALCTNDTMVKDYGSFRYIFPYSPHSRITGFISTHQKSYWDSTRTVCCWYIEGLGTDDTRFVLTAHGIIHTSKSDILRSSHRGSIQTGDLTLMVECDSGQQFSAPWDDSAIADGSPQELQFTEDPEQSALKGIDKPFVFSEMPCSQSKNKAWIMSERNERMMWIPPASRGFGRWYGRKLVLAGESGCFTLIDFTNVDTDKI